MLDIPSDRMTLHELRAMARTTLDEALGLRPGFMEHRLDGGDGGAAGEGRFVFGTALEPVGHRRFGGC